MWLSESSRRHSVPTLEEPRFRGSVLDMLVLSHAKLMGLRFAQVIKNSITPYMIEADWHTYRLGCGECKSTSMRKPLLLGLALFPSAFSPFCLGMRDRSNHDEPVQQLRLFTQLYFHYCGNTGLSGLDLADHCRFLSCSSGLIGYGYWDPGDLCVFLI